MISSGIRTAGAMVFLAAAIVMTFFVFLAGVTNTTPFNNTYFLQANTAGIEGARDVSQWTYFYICSPGNVDCSGAWPAPAVGWAWAANANNAPADLIGDYGGGTTSKYYYYMWRFGWVLYLIGFAFAFFSLFIGCAVCVSRIAPLASLMATISFFFYTIATSLMTATFVKMRDSLQGAGFAASLGQYAFGFTWGAWACVFVALILFCLGGRGDSAPTGIGPARRKSVKSVRSNRESIGSRRVKEEYP